MGIKVVVGMSGGVDSSVAAYLLKKEGYDVIGVTLRLWQSEEQAVLEDQGGCCGLSGVEDARRVCRYLGIPHYVFNFKEEFRKYVIDDFIDNYVRVCTPNPCILCNKYLKWGLMYKRASEIGASFIATGHYARIEKLLDGRYTVKNSVTADKDQTYVLYNLSQELLEHTLLPIGDYDKKEIREIAEREGIPTARKRDSQDICFIPDHDYKGYIKNEAGDRLKGSGNFVDKDGRVLGTHTGITDYTIGQRKGLGLSMGRPVFVTEIDPDHNTVVIGDSEELFSEKVYFNNVNFMADPEVVPGKKYMGKVRYSSRDYPLTAEEVRDGIYRADFLEPVRAAAPGQAIVLYDGDHVALGGTIMRPPVE